MKEFVIDHSPWFIAAVVVSTIFVVVWLADNQQVPQAASPGATATAIATPHASPSATAVNEQFPALRNAVYAFEEAYNSGFSKQRTEQLRRLVTPQYLATLVDPSLASSVVGQATQGLIARVDRSYPNSVQPEEFDAQTWSVFSIVKIDMMRSEELINSFRQERLTYWVNTPNGWKLSGIQVEGGDMTS